MKAKLWVQNLTRKERKQIFKKKLENSWRRQCRTFMSMAMILSSKMLSLNLRNKDKWKDSRKRSFKEAYQEIRN